MLKTYKKNPNPKTEPPPKKTNPLLQILKSKQNQNNKTTIYNHLPPRQKTPPSQPTPNHCNSTAFLSSLKPDIPLEKALRSVTGLAISKSMLSCSQTPSLSCVCPALASRRICPTDCEDQLPCSSWHPPPCSSWRAGWHFPFSSHQESPCLSFSMNDGREQPRNNISRLSRMPLVAGLFLLLLAVDLQLWKPQLCFGSA